jgi:hypothetical protein
MSKRIALKDEVRVDDVVLSGFARDVRAQSDHERRDVSGFNATGANEYLAGQTEQGVVVEFYGSYGAGEVHQTIYPLHRDREIFPFAWRTDMTNPASVTNPELRGNVQALSYGPGATRGEVDTFSVPFSPADEVGLVWYDTPEA